MKIAVIGGGPAGCAAAYHLQKNGKEVILLEAQEQIGGRTRSLRKDGFVLDTGAGFVTNFYPRLFALAKECSFADKIQEMNRISGLFRNDQLAELNIGSALSFLKFPFLGMWEKCKMAAWTLECTLKSKHYDLADPRTLAPIDLQSIEEYAYKRLNENIYHTLIRPGIEPFWYFSCADVSCALLLGLTSKAAGASFYSLPEGIDQIATSLTSSIESSTSNGRLILVLGLFLADPGLRTDPDWDSLRRRVGGGAAGVALVWLPP